MPVTPVWLPGLVTLTVSPPLVPLMVQENEVVPDALVASVAVTTTVKVPAVVGVTATEAGAAEQVAAVGAPVQVMAAVTD